MKNLILLAILIIFATACAPPRTHTVARQPANKRDVATVKTDEKVLPMERFADTTVIRLPDIQLDESSVLNSEVTLAIDLFYEEKYQEACGKFESLSGTITDNDENFFEVRYYLVECMLRENKFEESRQELEFLLNRRSVPDKVMEKILIRLGQIYCLQNKPDTAQPYFNRLKNEFPKSIYIPLANCQSVTP